MKTKHNKQEGYWWQTLQNNLKGNFDLASITDTALDDITETQKIENKWRIYNTFLVSWM